MLLARAPERPTETDSPPASHSMAFRHQKASPRRHRRRLSKPPNNSVRHVPQIPKLSLTVRPTLLATSGSVIKAQVLAGGRGKGRFDTGLQGGVHKVDRYVLLSPRCTHKQSQYASVALNMPRSSLSRCLAQTSSQSRLVLEGGSAMLYVAFQTLTFSRNQSYWAGHVG